MAETEAKTNLFSIILLTRKEHGDGHWITELQNQLEKRGCVVEIINVEDFADIALAAVVAPKWSCLVNRVSDAAPPSDYKACLAAIAFA
jgi:hypothetical protein